MIQQNIYSTIQMFAVSEIFFFFFKSLMLTKAAFIWLKNIKTVILWNISFPILICFNIHGKAEFSESLLRSSVSHYLLEIILKCLFGNMYYYWLYSVYIVLYRFLSFFLKIFFFFSKEQHEIEMFCRSLKWLQ